MKKLLGLFGDFLNISAIVFSAYKEYYDVLILFSISYGIKFLSKYLTKKNHS